MSSNVLSNLKSVIANLPRHEIAIGYGSRVVTQRAPSGSDALVDLLIVAKDEVKFIDGMKNRGYISYFSSEFAKNVPHEIAFFAGVKCNGIPMKFGVTSASRFLNQLNNWDNSFYIPGRLQKPVRILSQDDSISQVLSNSLRANHQHAVVAGLLALPEHFRLGGFTEHDLFESTVGLSYLGDIRVGLAENPNKIKNIVGAQVDELRAIYAPLLPYCGVEGRVNCMRCTKSSGELFSMLPDAFKKSAIPLVDPRESLIATLTAINRRESLQHALIAVGTTGPTECFKYLLRKIGKRFQ